MVDAVVFDLGGTLFRGENDVELAREAQYEALRERGYDVERSEFEAISRKADERFAEEYRGDYRRFEFGSFMEIFFDIRGEDAPPEVAAALDRTFWEARLENQRLDEHAESVLEFCRDRELLLGVITNGNRLMTESRLRSAGIEDEFDVVLYSTEIRAEKSTVEPFELFLEETGLDGAECVMVGDRLDEDTWASEAGMTTVHLADRDSPSLGPERQPDYSIEELDELKGIIDELA